MSASPNGVQKEAQITFTATTDESDPVVKVTFSYQGGGTSDEDTISPYEVTKTMDWTTMEDLTVTATFDFENIADQQDTVDVDVVDITILGSSIAGRGNNKYYQGRTSPTGLSVSRWDWEYDTTSIDPTWIDTNGNDDQSVWNGRFVISGELTVEATILEIPCTKSKNVTVMDRTGVAWNTPATAVEDNEALWGAPPLGNNEPLGELRDKDTDVTHIIVPQTSSGDWSDGVVLVEVPSGPCKGFWYVHSECLEIDMETVINRYIKSGGPPPESGATTFYDYNNANGRCIEEDMADFVQAVKNHEYNGTPPTAESLEGHFGRIEYRLNIQEHPGRAVEDLVDTSEAGLIVKVNDEVDFIEGALLLFTTDGDWSDAGPNWGGTGSLGSGKHTRYDIDESDYYDECTFGPENF
ncbi:MAG: hypothetical protein KAV82_10610 [Phycisphaerae bacterium]|nr:hypothetical protein [Phycisphaerae bacterium]